MSIRQLTPIGGEAYDASQKPPPFGHSLKYYFALDPDYVNLNNGSYGSLPLPVLFAVTKLGYDIERNPDEFHRLVLRPGLLAKARESVAKVIGANADEVVLVPNATSGVNTVLRNFEWHEGDVIIATTTTYDAVDNTILYLTDHSEPVRPEAVKIELTFPLTHAEILERFRVAVRDVKQKYAHRAFADVPPLSSGYSAENQGQGNKIVAVVDAIVANPGVALPWREIVRIAREEGVWTVLDAAHSIGQEADLNLSEAKPDFWVSNCHKWMYAKRGCAVLYVPKRNQHIIKSSVPTSHGYVRPAQAKIRGTDFVQQHEWTGTTDQTPYVTIPDVLAFREWLGGENVINAYCHQLALDGGKRLAEVLGTRVLDETGELTLNMTNVQLPLPVEKALGEVYTHALNGEINKYLQNTLLSKRKAYAAHYYHAGAWWVRCSAQVFNEISDFERLGVILKDVCKEVEEAFLSKRAT
ncbi:PLP-dependent transferase [Trametes meyenii]|nr:PLP-dependent transferase [Trametes meyenii]